MKNKVVKLLFLGLFAIIGVGGLLTPSVYASDPFCDKLESGSKAYEAAGCTENAELTNVIRNILNSIIGVAGLIAVIFIIIGGVQYMSSTGDPGKIKKAKDTILYALIGLIICALAFAIVNWTIGVLNDSNNTANVLMVKNPIAFLEK